MRVMITGVAGYVGSALARDLLLEGYEVVGVDNLSGGGSAVLSFLGLPRFNFINLDLTKAESLEKLLEGVDVVIHLAAIVGDPACAQNPQLAESVNWQAACSLYDAISKKSSVSKFIFSSTCSNYGKSDSNQLLDESSALKPVSLYAELKVRFEKYISTQAVRDSLSVTILRFATVYGISPRMRFDLTVNEFTRDALLKKELLIFGEQFWRPYCHVRDISLACRTVITAETSLVKGEVFNVGSSAENYQKKMIAELLLKYLPDLNVKYVKKQEDPRDYRVSFDKIQNRLGFKPEMNVPKGIEEILDALKKNAFGDPYSKEYSNI